ncbi:MAG TPA: TlpA disulfide reductase family protein [Vicinamibacteria bacterium]|nr:TlpA disulfide reductase family protein [Vicinamibacteria bacterium]
MSACSSLLLLLSVLQPAPSADPEVRIVEYLRENVTSGQPVVVSRLYNEVFTAPEERAVLDRLFNSFFKIPLFVAQYQAATGRPPSLEEIAEQFRFRVPGQADVMLRIMQADPRMPRFLERDPATGEIKKVDAQAILAHPRFGKSLERTVAGFEGRPAPSFSIPTYDGPALESAALAGRPHLIYFWFTDCPPCVKTAPVLVELHKAYRAKGLEVVAVNADKVLEVPTDDAQRAEYARTHGFTFRLAHMTPEMQSAYGEVSVFPTIFAVDRQGTVVQQLVSAPSRAALEGAIQLALR